MASTNQVPVVFTARESDGVVCSGEAVQGSVQRGDRGSPACRMRKIRDFCLRNLRYISLPDEVHIPKLCPACLSRPAGNVVEEESLSRQSANYVVAQRLEWRRAEIFYCETCARRLGRFTGAGIVCGTVCAAITFVVILRLHAYDNDPFILLGGSVLMGFPVYSLLTTMPKGIILGKPYPKSMRVRVRHTQYRAAMQSRDSVQTTTPLADGKGVWTHCHYDVTMTHAPATA